DTICIKKLFLRNGQAVAKRYILVVRRHNMLFKADTGSRPVRFKSLVMTTGALACPLKKIYEKTFYNIINWVFKY
ncbi:MAG: hypothetical protein MSH08_03525, partial [Ezakiella sp.]|nr:hypothetical protein [Ezakiella sp.]